MTESAQRCSGLLGFESFVNYAEREKMVLVKTSSYGWIIPGTMCLLSIDVCGMVELREGFK